MKLFIFILLTFSALNPVLVYSSCEEAFLPLTSVQKKAQKSVWAVHSLYGSGTGFFIGPKTFVTNVHVLIEALLTVNGIKGITLIQEGKPLILKVKVIKHFSVTYDLAVLEIEGKVSDYLNLKQGVPSSQENLFSISYSNGNFQVIDKTGDIFYKSEFEYIFPGNDSNSFGASGSPVLNTDGEVVGVLHVQSGNALHAVKIIHLQNLLKQKVEFFKSPKDHLEHSIKEATEAAEAAEQGNIIAQGNLAAFYRQGVGVKQDYKKAFDWFEKAAKQGHVTAQFNLGYFYDKGLGVKQDFEKAFNLYEKAAKQGYTPAQFNLAAYYWQGLGVKQDFEKAFDWYEKAAKQGDVSAQNNLGSLYYLGYGAEQDFEKAFDWYEKAAKQGYASAQNNLGSSYRLGRGVKQDHEKAFNLYEKAAKQGYAPAQKNLAVFYKEGLGVKKYIKKLLIGVKKLQARL